MAGEAAPAAAGAEPMEVEEEEIMTEDVKACSAEELKQRIRLLDNDIRVMRSESQRLKHEVGGSFFWEGF